MKAISETSGKKPAAVTWGGDDKFKNKRVNQIMVKGSIRSTFILEYSPQEETFAYRLTFLGRRSHQFHGFREYAICEIFKLVIVKSIEGARGSLPHHLQDGIR